MNQMVLVLTCCSNFVYSRCVQLLVFLRSSNHFQGVRGYAAGIDLRIGGVLLTLLALGAGAGSLCSRRGPSRSICS